MISTTTCSTTSVSIDDDIDVDGDTNVVSLMGNVLLDFGDDDGWGGYIGGGAGYAWVKAFDFEDDKDGAWAWQIIAGVRKAISPNVDVGLKYRYFQTGNLSFRDEFDDGTNSSSTWMPTPNSTRTACC